VEQLRITTGRSGDAVGQHRTGDIPLVQFDALNS